MRRALEIAAWGTGRVEPNPQVGAVIVDEQGTLIGEGHHQQFGGPHAEVNAISAAAGNTAGKTLFVTLEPCSHHGKTPPCSEAVIEAGFAKVVVAMLDPSPHTAGRGVQQLREAGIEVEVGMLEADARALVAPFLKLLTTGRPYVHAKWAMTLDGKLASRIGHSQWISSPESRAIVHELRGRMDAIVAGAKTVASDDPLLTARPVGPRTATRVVVDSQAELPLDSQLVKTISEAPLLLATRNEASPERVEQLRSAGVEVVQFASPAGTGVPLGELLDELGRRQMTNVLFEGGGTVLGSLFDEQLVDEVHVFVAPKIVGGLSAVTPVGGIGLEQIPALPSLNSPSMTIVGGDVYIHGCVNPTDA
ncbi:Riboflavin biosynthesis protein RibD [Symmachiella dynata]|nr:Riboflavin biosynthesis protein RibD [Symmachiella dynata]